MLVSVLVPCWNAEATIARALASALEADDVELECVVVDDASTDGTASIVEAIAARDARVRLVRQPANEGVSAARNRGLDEVRGDWLTMLDADDRYTPGGLATLVRAALVSDALAVIGQQVWWNGGGRRWLGPLYDIPDIRLPGRKALRTHPGLLYFVAPHAKLFHRSTFEGLRFSGRVLGDQPWIIRALLRAGDRIDVLGDTVYEWYRPPEGAGPSSITSRTRSSGRGGVEAAAVAREAFAAVADEARARLAPEDADRVLDRYAERLLRSDLGVHLARSLGRGDPTIGDLFGAIDGFVAAIPSRHVAASDALARDIVEPPLLGWRRVDPAGRAAFWGLVATARRVDPGIARKLGARGRLALAAAGVWPPVAAAPTLSALSLTGALERWLGRASRAIRSLRGPG